MTITYHFSSCIAEVIIRYLMLKQALGRKYDNEFCILKHLDAFLNTRKSDLTAESFFAWLRTKQLLTSTGRREWMRVTRNFCLYRQRTEPFCFLPDILQFPERGQAIQPHIFTECEVIQLFNAIQQLKPNSLDLLRQEKYRLALILAYTSGVRRRELTRLIVGDYNPVEHTLLIRESKFHKSRLIPLSSDGWVAIELLLKKRRDLGLSVSEGLPLLWNDCEGTKFYSKISSWKIFHSIFRIANIRTKNKRLPRPHDLRHTFAVHALLRWYREGFNVQVKLPILAIYMGHVSIESTQYYLRFIEEVIGSASERFEKCYGELVTEFSEGGTL